MKFTSEQEADQFVSNIKMANKLLERIKIIGEKDKLTKTDREELLNLQSQLYEINNWFVQTAR